ncbi:MAG: hypothetical protein UR66_C0019G0002 [Candidatus Moranbacteria bacterium GW2011_GWE1_35_17]|nr:MAG: hypothetical protein UR66_C0019G0002 [Candidatus Moranbacteria bacterium GW2011_GWE1_35_17]HCU01301.1 hypothetical protein [Candidatus Nomurabacteria bacterium]
MEKNSKKVGLVKAIGIMSLTIIFVIPFLSFARSTKDIYVDADAGSSQDGSINRPYRKIGDAIDKARKTDKDVEIHVANGVYRENIEVPSGVEVFGESKNKTIIEAKDDDRPVVKLNNKTEINKFTIEGGEYGIVVDDGDKALVDKCIIRDNDKDGIKIKQASVEDKYSASIIDSDIYDNGRSGIYSEKRRLVIIDNYIHDNDGDGLDIDRGTKAWIEGNKIKENEKSGMKLVLDGSEIWTKGNTYYENNREGLEINSYGGKGRIDINKSKFYKNENYGIAKVKRGSFSNSIWSGFTVQSNVVFWDNTKGNML